MKIFKLLNRKCYAIFVTIFVLLFVFVWTRIRWIYQASWCAHPSPLNYYAESSENRYKWPPDHPNDLFDPRTGYYNLTLPVRIRIDPAHPTRGDWIQDYVIYLKNHFQGHKFEGSPLRQLVQMDEKMRLDANRPNYLLYPQAINVEPLIEAIKRGEPIDQVPINNPELLVKKIPRHVCNPDDKTHTFYDLIVIIKSCYQCFEERQYARQTYMKPKLWNNFSVGFVFVIGDLLFQKDFRYNISGMKINIHVSLPNMTSGRIVKEVESESDKYGDLLIGSFEDTYFNLTLKQMFAFRWATAFCRKLTDIFLFLDLDRSLIPQNLIRMIQDIPVRVRPNIAGGMPYIGLDVYRPAANLYRIKWSASVDEIPWKQYPSYPPGPGYMLGVQAVQDVAIANAFTQYFRLEDVFLGFVFEKLNRRFVAFEGFKKHGVRLKKPRKSISIPKSDAANIYDWDKGDFNPHIP